MPLTTWYAAPRRRRLYRHLNGKLAQIWESAAYLQPEFTRIDRRVVNNVRKLQKAFKDNRVGPHHFAGSTGYGHGDLGRETLDKVRLRATASSEHVARHERMRTLPLLRTLCRSPSPHRVLHACHAAG
jgi:hypothetical protein